jgi:benzoate membrane transport protein
MVFQKSIQAITQALTPSTWLAGLLIMIVGFTSSLVLTFDAAHRAQLTTAELNSWVWAITVGTGLLTMGLSLVYRQPVITAWSTPGIAVLAANLGDYSLSAAVGAYIFVGLSIAVLGFTGLFDRVIKFVPQGVALAVLGGVLFKYGLGLFSSITTEPLLVLGMIAVFLVARLRNSTVPMAWALLAGFALALGFGKFIWQGISLQLVQPLVVIPHFEPSALIGLGIPLLALALASQNAPGLAVMQAYGYTPPTKGALIGTGLVSVVFAPMLGHGFTLAAITAAIGNSETAHPDKALRFGAGITSGFLKLLLGLFGGTLVAVFLAIPKALVAAMAGLALLATIQNCLVGALADPKHRDASLFALLMTASGVEFFGLGSAFWGLVVGTVLAVVWQRHHGTQTP